MYKNLKTEEEGFTIIEVVLVLAIAALIFLIVFLALPQLQKSRRDTARRNDGGRMVSQLESWAGDHSGNYPTTNADRTSFVNNYVIPDLQTPDNTEYNVTWNGAGDPPAGTNNVRINVETGNNCDGAALGAREVAVRVRLEAGVYCQDNR